MAPGDGARRVRVRTPASISLLRLALAPETPTEGASKITNPRGRAFISEVFRFEELGFEEVQEDFYKVFFRDVEIGEFDVEALRFRPVQMSR